MKSKCIDFAVVSTYVVKGGIFPLFSLADGSCQRIQLRTLLAFCERLWKPPMASVRPSVKPTGLASLVVAIAYVLKQKSLGKRFLQYRHIFSSHTDEI